VSFEAERSGTGWPIWLLTEGHSIASPKFVDALLVEVTNPYTELVTFLEIDNEAIQLLTSRTLGVIISHALKPSAKHKQSEEKTLEAKRALGHLYTYHAKKLQDSLNDSTQQDLSVQSFVDLLRAKAGRRLFWANAEDELEPEENEVGQGILLVGRKKTVDPLVNILRKATSKSTQEVTSALDTRFPQNGTGSNLSQGDVGLQLLYHVLLVFWSLTFEEQVASKIEQFVCPFLSCCKPY
jgi:V-type H+-transporting ATPase subunit H